MVNHGLTKQGRPEMNLPDGPVANLTTACARRTRATNDGVRHRERSAGPSHGHRRHRRKYGCAAHVRSRSSNRRSSPSADCRCSHKDRARPPPCPAHGATSAAFRRSACAARPRLRVCPDKPPGSMRAWLAKVRRDPPSILPMRMPAQPRGALAQRGVPARQPQTTASARAAFAAVHARDCPRRCTAS